MSLISSPAGRKSVIVGCEDKQIRVWDAATGRCVQSLEGHLGAVRGVAISTDGTRFVSGSTDSTIRVWDVDTSQCIQTLKNQSHPVMSVAISIDGTRIVSGSTDRAVRVWDAATGQCIRDLNGHQGPVMSVAISTDGTRVVSGSSKDTSIRLWDAAEGQCIRTLEGHQGGVFSVAISSDGTRLVSGSTDSTIRAWDAATGQCIRTFHGHRKTVISVAISTDGTRFVSGADDSKICVWDAATGTRIHTMESHHGKVESVAISTDGTRFVSGSADKSIRVWDMSTGDCMLTLDNRSAAVFSVAIGVVQQQPATAFTLLIFGNPGSGKSALANCIAGEKLFDSRGSCGDGVTQGASYGRDARGQKYVDLPGLADVQHRRDAAQACTEVLKRGGMFKILFIFTEQHGRLRPEDRTTMSLILSAAPDIGKNFGVVVNQCGPSVKHFSKALDWRTKFESILFQNTSPAHSTFYLPRRDDLDGKQDAIVDLGQDFHLFLESLPIADVPPEKVTAVSPETFEELHAKAIAMDGDTSFKLGEIESRLQIENEQASERGKHNMKLLSIAAALMGAIVLLFWVMAASAEVHFGPKKVHVDVGLSILLLAYTFYRMHACLAVWTASSRPEEMDNFSVLGRKFAAGEPAVFLRHWHIWTAAQTVDSLTDVLTLRDFIGSGAPMWVVIMWAITTLVSVSTPLRYHAGLIDFNSAALWSFAEDLVQMVITTWKVFGDENNDLSGTLIFSFLFAVAGCIEGMGNVNGRLHHTGAVHTGAVAGLNQGLLSTEAASL